MKLLSLAAAGIAAVTTAQASEGINMAGFYAGLNLGGMNTNGKIEFTPTGGELKTEKKDKFALTYGLMTGYNYMLSETFLIGAEATVQFGKNKIDSKVTNTGGNKYTETYTQQPAFGLAARAGVVVNKNCLLYVRLGVEHSKYTYKVNVTNGAGGAVDGAAINKSSGRVRANIGAGVETYLTRNVFVGGEYRYAFAQKLEGKSNVGTVKINASQHYFLAKVGYKF